MKSMTGFGQASFKNRDVAIRIEIRSVNHRFLKINANLPESFARHQDDLESMIRKLLSRGSISLTITVDPCRPAAVIDRKMLKSLHQELDTIRRSLKIAQPVSLETLMNAYNAVGASRKDSNLLADRYAPRVKTLLRTAIVNLLRMRTVEGDHTRNDCRKRLTTIRSLVKEAVGRAPVVAAAHRDRLATRIRDILSAQGQEIGKDSMAKEIALAADRCDVSEELARLDSHVGQFMELLTSDGEVGRRLDFLLQEMNREATTLSSKSNDPGIVRHAIEIKVHIEKIREQIENVE